jgi:hypothetical protein
LRIPKKAMTPPRKQPEAAINSAVWNPAEKAEGLR